MGIFGALTTAVSGLRAQSFALENISGNIANSQTTAFKRSDTTFSELISNGAAARQTSGSVFAQTLATNNIQGDIQSSNTATFMAINGAGYFVVAPPSNVFSGNASLGSDLYTRRGDFQLDKDGYLVNGGGYYLKTLAVDLATGMVTGSVPEIRQFTNDVLPARATDSIQYRANLPSYPQTALANKSVPGSELLSGAGYTADPRTATTSYLPATALGTGITTPLDLIGSGDVTQGNTLTLQLGSGATKTFTMGTGAGEFNTLDSLVQAITADSDLVGLTASNASGQLRLVANAQSTTFTIGGTGATELGLSAGAVTHTLGTAAGVVQAQDDQLFVNQSIAGGAITLYDQQGTPVNVQFRWAKVDSAATGGSDTWNLFYLSNSNASGADPRWTNVGQDYTFGPNSNLTPPLTSTMLNGLTINGYTLGDISLDFGTNGLTQFANDTGVANVSTLSQNGYAAGQVVRLSIDDNGAVTAYYSNNKTATIALVPLVHFNAENQLARLDGGAYAATDGSGAAILGTSGSIIGSALEGSNTDIADEFTKLIVTQQAYSANTRIVTTSNEMLQDALNMIR